LSSLEPKIIKELKMASARRYQIALGDATPEAICDLHLLSLARPGALIAAVRFVQLPQWREWGVTAASVHLSIGHADLLATLGDDDFAESTLAQFTEHLETILTELRPLCEPDALFYFTPIVGFDGWEWQERFNALLMRCLAKWRVLR
jgi:hypothetical protein